MNGSRGCFFCVYVSSSNDRVTGDVRNFNNNIDINSLANGVYLHNVFVYREIKECGTDRIKVFTLKEIMK